MCPLFDKDWFWGFLSFSTGVGIGYANCVIRFLVDLEALESLFEVKAFLSCSILSLDDYTYDLSKLDYSWDAPLNDPLFY